MNIQHRVEARRGCGFREPGGLYLVSGGLMAPCGKLPIPVSTCPTCGAGIKPARGWTWIDGDALAATKECDSTPLACMHCPLGKPIGRCGLLWIGPRSYKTPEDFIVEVLTVGVSRRIGAVPRGLEIGKTWVFVAHRKAITRVCDCVTHMECTGRQCECEECGGTGVVNRPAIFHAFRPTAIEYIVRDEDTDEHLEGLEKRGITLIKVTAVEDPLFEENQEAAVSVAGDGG